MCVAGFSVGAVAFVLMCLACNTTPKPSKACYREHGEAVFNTRLIEFQRLDKTPVSGFLRTMHSKAVTFSPLNPLNSSCILPGLLNNSSKVDCDPCDRNKTESDAT